MNINSNLGREEALQSSAVMEEIAAGTGSAFVHNNNDFDGGFARVAAPGPAVLLRFVENFDARDGRVVHNWFEGQVEFALRRGLEMIEDLG